MTSIHASDQVAADVASPTTAIGRRWRRSTCTCRRPEGRARRSQRQRQDHAAPHGGRSARPLRRTVHDRRRDILSGTSHAPPLAYIRTPRRSTTTSRCGSTSSTSPACTASPSGATTPTSCSVSSGSYDRVDDLPNTFSRGLRQKAAIALAFVRPFELLLVDEPFVGLDAAGKTALLDVARQARRGRARRCVVATHELASSNESSRLIALRDGEVALRRLAGGRRRARVSCCRRLTVVSWQATPRRHRDYSLRPMHEFITVSSSSYDPAALATKLTEKSAEGWTVVGHRPDRW